MNISAVIHRELKEESRRPANYWLRLAVLIPAIPVFGVILMDDSPARMVWTAIGPVWQQPSPNQSGARLFASLNCVVFAAIWILAPIMTADCISRERREGTLGLLFLTPLKALDIILGKSFLHGVRSLNVLVGVLPLLTIPFILGGITFKDVSLMAATNFSALLLALCAGILASTFSRDVMRSMAMAIAISLLFAWAFMTVHYVGFNLRHARLGVPATEDSRGSRWNAQSLDRGEFANVLNALWSDSFFRQGSQLVQFNTGMLPKGNRASGNNFNRIWTTAQSLPGVTGVQAMYRSWMTLAAAMFAGCAVFFLTVLRMAAKRLNDQWQEEPPSARMLWLESAFCSPVFWRSVFRNRLSRKLDLNPIGWLQEFRWQSRVAKWGWCLFILVIQIMLLDGYRLDELASGQAWLAFLFLLGLSFSAGVSFRQERENGAMELLLVTPLSEGQIIWGRVRGLWSQFLPALGLLILVWGYFKYFVGGRTVDGSPYVLSPFYLSLLLGSYLILPLVGLRFSMQAMPLMAAWLLSFLIAVAVPIFIMGIWTWALPWPWRPGMLNFTLLLLACQGLIGWMAHGLLRRTLVARRFVIQ